MKINFTWPDHLIPMVAEVDNDRYMVDLFLNSILLENDDNVPKRVTRMVLDLMHEDKPLWRLEIPLPALASHLAVDSTMNELEENQIKKMIGEYLSHRLKKIHEDPTIPSGHQGLLRRFPIRFLASAPPDTLIARAFSGTHLIGRESISVKPFENTMTFKFPVKGIWQTINNFDYTLGHRAYAGQEFAVDFVQLGPNGLLRAKKNNDSEDFFCFGADVEAMADGTVVALEGRLPDNPANCNQSSAQQDSLCNKYGYTSGRAGNHLIIKHNENRFSFYAHLKQNSLSVKEGDIVKKGQIIAQVGNSGACSQAHLHIQLNEGEDPLGSRGLPISFENLKSSSDQSLIHITQNNLIVHRTEI